jgi:hypothetical protein
MCPVFAGQDPARPVRRRCNADTIEMPLRLA